MREHKKQLWLRPDQYELVRDCLTHCKNRLENDSTSYPIHAMAARYAVRRINEILALMRDKPATAEAAESKP